MEKNEFVCDCDVIHTDAVIKTKEAMLPDEKNADISDFFKMFSDSTRIKILWALHENELCVCDIASVLGMTKSAVSHQLKTLRQSSLVKNRKEGKTVYYSLSDNHVKKIIDMAVEHLDEL